MYQTLEQRRRNWRRAICVYATESPGTHIPALGPGNEPDLAICFYCEKHITLEPRPAVRSLGPGQHWMIAGAVTIVEWP